MFQDRPATHDNIDNRQKFATFSTSKVTFPTIKDCNTPQKLKPKIEMKLIIPQKLVSSASMTSTEHFWWDDVEARPTRSKTEAWMAESLRVSVDFGRNRRPSKTIASALYHYRKCYSNCCRNAATIANAILKTAIGLSYRSDLFAVWRSNDESCMSSRPFILLA